ncbi:hypothetical protein GCM10017557_16850 [Streptomyces aurantiacus]|uniref:Uncharacterized protein n=1 Tax=Streptomyces aurantiacus TaxID=47760 RepID=A0A7G1NZ62_9ACTN|nr:hypothetical protein GCM10017557_16850 [Streptomyces aurantiacus]
MTSAAAAAWQFSAREHAVREAREKTTLRIIAVSFFVLAANLSVDAVRALTGTGEVEHPIPGIVPQGEPDAGGEDRHGEPDVVHRLAQPVRHFPGAGRGEWRSRRFGDVLLVTCQLHRVTPCGGCGVCHADPRRQARACRRGEAGPVAGIEREPAEVRIPKTALDAFAVVLSVRTVAMRKWIARPALSS